MLILLTGKFRSPLNDGYSVLLLDFYFLFDKNLLFDYVGKILERGPFTELIYPSMLNNTSDNIPDHLRLQMETFIELDPNQEKTCLA